MHADPVNEVDDVSYILDNPDKYANCRDIAKKYYDRKKNTLKLLEIYGKLGSNYYD